MKKLALFVLFLPSLLRAQAGGVSGGIPPQITGSAISIATVTITGTSPGCLVAGTTALYADCALSRLGIGKASPAYALDVTGAGQFSGQIIATTGTFTGNAFSVGSSTLVVTGGNVGIGTSNPLTTLHVLGPGSGDGLRVYAPGTQVPGINFGNVTTGALGQFTSNNSGDVTIGTGLAGVTNAAIFKASGNVGIGTTNPGALLQVGGSSGQLANPTQIRMDASFANSYQPTNQQLKLNLINASSTEAYGIAISSDAGMWYHSGDSSAGSGYHAFATGGTERMRINKFGNVGIGTTNPAQTLDVTGSGRFSGASTTLYIKDSGSAPQIIFQNNAGTLGQFGITGSKMFISGSSGGIDVYPQNGAVKATLTDSSNVFLNRLGIGSLTAPTASFGVTAVAGDTNAVSISSNNGTGLMTVTQAGNVGIGTTNPAFGLEVNNANGVRLSTTSTANRGFVLSSGNNATLFGGPASSLGGLLTLQSITGQIPLDFDNTAGSMVGRIRSDGTTMNLISQTNYSFWEGGDSGAGTQKMVLDGSGNLGIGTTNPGAILEVAGTSTKTLLFGNTVSSFTIAGNQSSYVGGDISDTLLTTGSTGNGTTVSVTWTPACPTGSLGDMFDVTTSTLPPTMAYGVSSATATFAGTLPNSDKIAVKLRCYR